METMTATASMPFPREPANYDEVSMQQSMLFSDSLKDLKNLRKQLYSAAEYFELSYTNDDQKHISCQYGDHLGSVTYKVNDLLDEKVDEVSGTELRVSCIEQRLRTCQEYIDREGISQQSLVINTPNYHKRYILPVGETMHGAVRTKSKYQGCSLDDGDEWHQFKNERRTVSPHRFPLLRSGSLSSKPTTPKNSNPSTPNRSRPTTPNPSLGRQPYISEPRKSASMRIRVEKESPKDSGEQYPSKSKRLLKALLSRRKSKKDDMLYTYLDEY
ncbi:UNVERIFIED_CONTAM: protein ABIL3 [Sesamum radiatum]|uniref:Protein ABIL3 n=1 Tax=Sesamum radiatum TaxID=300843 RepID=A0AAW2JZD4_SESRA